MRFTGPASVVALFRDVLDAFQEIRVLEAYEVDGARTPQLPVTATALERARPVWRTFPGWRGNTSGTEVGTRRLSRRVAIVR